MNYTYPADITVERWGRVQQAERVYQRASGPPAESYDVA